MNHLLAVKSRATERYLLDELDDESRLAFEEHYFSCQDCATDVKAAAQFVDNAKAVLRAQPAIRRAPVRFPSWLQSTAVPAAIAACLAVGYFVPHPKKPVGGLIATVALPAGARGAQATERMIVVDKETSLIQVRLDVADDVKAPRLLWRVRTAGGLELASFLTARENEVTLPLPAAEFPVGRYEVILSSDTPGAAIMERFGFAIQHR